MTEIASSSRVLRFIGSAFARDPTVSQNRSASRAASASARSISLRFVLASTAIVSGACSSGSTTTEDALAARLRECTFLSSGPVRLEVPEIDASVRECVHDCLAATSCDELRPELFEGCRWFDEVRDCERACEELDRFVCANGESIPSTLRCNGRPDCDFLGRDESDEEGCPVFLCANGAPVVESARCDGELDCVDESDEFDCPGRFTCANGEVIREAWRCDGKDDCGDDSDELGCPTLACDSGALVPAAWRCNLAADCADGSDEAGCATTSLMCD